MICGSRFAGIITSFEIWVKKRTDFFDSVIKFFCNFLRMKKGVVLANFLVIRFINAFFERLTILAIKLNTVRKPVCVSSHLEKAIFDIVNEN